VTSEASKIPSSLVAVCCSDEAGIDMDGCLSMKTFKRVMCTVGLKVPDLELMQVLTELGVQDDDRVSFALFKQVCQRVQ
jgi:Ca2+-binding EF-hand superfamily protein